MHTITVGMLLIEVIIIMSLMSLVTCKNIKQYPGEDPSKLSSNYKKIIPSGLDNYRKVITPDGK